MAATAQPLTPEDEDTWIGKLCGAVLHRMDGKRNILNPNGDHIKKAVDQRRIIKGTQISENVDPILAKIKPEDLAEIARAYICELEPCLKPDSERVKLFEEHCKKYKRGAQTREWMYRQRKVDRNARATVGKSEKIIEENARLNFLLKRASSLYAHHRQSQKIQAQKQTHLNAMRRKNSTITRATQTPHKKVSKGL